MNKQTTFRVPTFDDISVLVVGDVMLDRYWYGDTGRISPEAPVPVVHIQKLEERAGGAGNVALNLAALGCGTGLISVIGDDARGQRLGALLQQAGIQTHLLPQADWSTVTKLRVIGRNQQLIRLDFEDQPDRVDTDAMLEAFTHEVKKHQAVILSDYGKGALQDIQPLIQIAKQAGVPVLIDPKSEDFSVYQDATLVTPNMKEFQAVVGFCVDDDSIVTKGHALMQAHNIQSILITRSERGMTLLQKNSEPLHLPTRAREVFDVTGAGDTVIAATAAGLAGGLSPEESARFANFAAGIVVRKLGAATVSIPEIRRAMQRQFKSGLGVLDEDELMVAVLDARAQGETVVMTNGCFDILHPGHIAYLDQARSLGKRLIVAVNSDESVRKLKGDGRPINSLQSRMAVLAALRAVDWVVPFLEETPKRLIEKISPDILVKGGDYQVEEIAGHEHVLSNGGKVEILQFVDGCSTSNTIDKIRNLDTETLT